MENVEQIGDGTYGIVYKATLNDKLRNKYGLSEIAIKRNFIDKTADFIGNIRELDFLSRLKGHPHIVKLLDFVFDKPFEYKKKSKKDLKEDSLFFYFEKADFDVESLFMEETKRNALIDKFGLGFEDYREILFQTLLGLEYLHDNKIMHRDIKPLNVLVYINPPFGRGVRPGYTEKIGKKITKFETKETGPRLQVKICDFGMSNIFSTKSGRTSELGTPGYRAPEMEFGLEYDYKIDTWSMGVFFYELVSRNLFVDVREEIIPQFLNRMPKFIEFKRGTRYYGLLKQNNIKREDSAKSIRKSWREQMNIEGLVDSEKIDSFCDLLDKLLQFFPEDRITVKEALEHEFFSDNRERLEEFRANNPACMNLGDLPVVHKDCFEREYLRKLVFRLMEVKENLNWWEYRVIFHSIDLFDRYLCKIHNGKRLFSKEEISYRFLGCVYMFLKYYNTDVFTKSFKEIAEEVYETEYKDKCFEFEKEILTMFDGKIFQETVYELDTGLSHKEYDQLIEYILGESSNGLTRREIFSNVFGIKKI
jgi:serine/threonine protein kinase